VPLAREAVAILDRVAELEPWSDRHMLSAAQVNLADALRTARRGPAGRKWFRRRSDNTPPLVPSVAGFVSPLPADHFAVDPPAPADDHAGVFERFSEPARRSVIQAREEAKRLNHTFIGTGHILLGLIGEGEGNAAKALQALGISLEPARSQVEEMMGRGLRAPSEDIPFSPRAMNVLELALHESLGLGSDYVGTEHILLGLIRESEDIPARVLVRLGTTPSAVGQRLLPRLVAERADPGPAQAD
jgi:Clp amino terminal domain, pathogenicity island component